MNTETDERPAPGVCWTFRSDEVPDYLLSAFDGDCAASPYLTPSWSHFWERAWPDTRADFWVMGAQDGGVMALWTIKRRRWKWDWVFCQPYGTTGVFHSSAWDNRDSELLVDVLMSTAGDECIQVSISGDLLNVTPPGWKEKTHDFTSWVYDDAGRTSQPFLGGISDNHRRNVDKGRAANPDISMIYGPVEVERMQSQMQSSRSQDSRIVLNRALGTLFGEVFAGSRNLHWYAAWHDGHCAATCLWLTRGNHAVYVDGAVDSRSADTGINHFLFAHVLTEMQTAGVRLFDFGAGPRGRSSEGLARFKEGWGARPIRRQERVLRTPLYSLIRRIV